MLVLRDRRPHPTFYIYSDTLPKGAMGSIIAPPPWARKEGSGVEATEWPRSLEQAARTACPGGPVADRIEVHSHGVPGAIVLNPLVTQANVAAFGALVRRLLRPGGMIELLCCSVARPDLPGLAAAARARGDAGAAALCEMLGVNITSREEWGGELERGLVFDPAPPTPAALAAAKPNGPAPSGLLSTPARAPAKAPKTRLTPDEVVQLLKAAIATGAPGDPVKSTGNGPLFCAALAKLTGGRVRAALGSQWEEVKETSLNPKDDYKAIGCWEGHVIDFTPGGGVTYAGYDLPRAMFPQLELIGGPLLAA